MKLHRIKTRYPRRRMSATQKREQLGQLNLFRPPQVASIHALDSSFSRARRMHDSGQLREAEVLYRRAILEGDDAVGALINLSLLVSTPGEAMTLVGRALALDPASTDAHYHLAVLYYDARWLEPARIHNDVVLARRPQDAPTLFNQALVLSALERHSEALALLERYLRLEVQPRSDVKAWMRQLQRSAHSVT
jgi:tetratricopeptide (TPR) repeat protein